MGHLADRRYPDREPYTSLPREFDRWAVEGKRPDPVDTGVPQPAHVDAIGGPVTGPAADRDSYRAPGTRVLRSFDTTGCRGTFTLTHTFRDVQESFYLGLHGSRG